MKKQETSYKFSREKLYEFINSVCEALGIEPPKVEFDHLFTSKTMIAQYSTSEHLISFKPLDDVNPADIVFSTVHELRHAWQFKYHIEWFKDYKDASQLSVNAYNLQYPEVDANAYAMIFMMDLFGIKPLFNNLDECIKCAIKARAFSICEEEERKDLADEVLSYDEED